MCRVCEFPLLITTPTISGYPLHIPEPSWEETYHQNVLSEISWTEVGLQHSTGGAGTTLARAMGLSPGCIGASSGNFLKIWMTGSNPKPVRLGSPGGPRAAATGPVECSWAAQSLLKGSFMQTFPTNTLLDIVHFFIRVYQTCNLEIAQP